MSVTLHKTKHFTDNQRATLLRSAVSISDAVKNYFADKACGYTVEDVYKYLRSQHLISPKVPISSVKARMTELLGEWIDPKNKELGYRNAYLVKTEEVKQGGFGKNQRLYKRKTGTAIAELFNN